MLPITLHNDCIGKIFISWFHLIDKNDYCHNATSLIIVFHVVTSRIILPSNTQQPSMVDHLLSHRQKKMIRQHVNTPFSFNSPLRFSSIPMHDPIGHIRKYSSPLDHHLCSEKQKKWWHNLNLNHVLHCHKNTHLAYSLFLTSS